MALEIPRGARVTGVALTLGKTERMVAVAMGPERARTDYQTILNRGKDPILVEWNGEAAGVDVLDVKAFPLTKTDPGRIELTIELPQLSTLAIDASAKTIEIVNGASRVTHRKPTRPITIDVPQQRELAAVSRTTPRPHVNATTSFYVGMPLSMEVPTITFGGGPPRRQGPFSSVDKQEIRKEIKRHIVRLGRCYEQVVEYKGGIEGESVLHFQIDGDGKVVSTTIDGTIEDETIISCLEGVVAQFEFRPGDGNVIVNYPLRFQLAL